MSKQTPPAPTASALSPCPTMIQISRTPRHWKLIQYHCTTRPPPVALNDDKSTEEEFRLIFSEVDKYNQMKTEIRGRQKQSLSEDEKNRLFQRARDEAMMTAHAKLLKEIQAGSSSGT